MRIAVLSDIHGNLNAFHAVLEDIRRASPDLVVHGGDLADGGSSPIEIVDHIRDLGWDGVLGNTDEMLVRPASLEDFASQSSAPPHMWSVIRQIASATRSRLGDERLAWLRELPVTATLPGLAWVHATPQSCWRAPAAEANEEDLESCYGSLPAPMIVFGHTHIPTIRNLSGHPKLLVNCGSVGLPYDGDPAASYLLLDGLTPTIRRVEYNLERELRALSACGLPGADWTARMLRASYPLLP